MPARSATTNRTTASSSTASATWVWRDASADDLAPGAVVPSGPPPRGCF